MLEFIAKNAYIVLIIISAFMMLFYLDAGSGRNIFYFKKKKYNIDPEAEQNLEKVLKKYVRSRDFKLLPRTTINFNGTEFTFDAILLAYSGTVAFVSDGHGGQIYGDATEPDWTQVFEGTKIHFSNPLKALNGSVKFFRDIYRFEKVKCGETDAMLVFTNREVGVAVPKSLPVVQLPDLLKKLEGGKYLADNKADIDAMERAIKKYTVAE